MPTTTSTSTTTTSTSTTSTTTSACYAPVASVAAYQLLPISDIIGVTSIQVQEGGSGYSPFPTVTITDPAGTGATAFAIVVNGVITAIKMLTAGSGYFFDPDAPAPPTVTITDTTGTGAMATATTGTVASAILPMPPMDYSFTRKAHWTTGFQRFKDQSTQSLPTQLIAIFEFAIQVERWTPDAVTVYEDFIDSVCGTAYPFQFIAPDDGVVYNVRFKDDPQGYTLPAATVRTGELNLITVGDVDNSLNNSAIYPPYVESVTFTVSTASTTSTTTS